MTKTEARKRAKARAARKAVKREPDANRPDQKVPPGRFDPGTSSIKGPRANIKATNFATARRGAARSR